MDDDIPGGSEFCGALFDACVLDATFDTEIGAGFSR